MTIKRQVVNNFLFYSHRPYKLVNGDIVPDFVRVSARYSIKTDIHTVTTAKNILFPKDKRLPIRRATSYGIGSLLKSFSIVQSTFCSS